MDKEEAVGSDNARGHVAQRFGRIIPGSVEIPQRHKRMMPLAVSFVHSA